MIYKWITKSRQTIDTGGLPASSYIKSVICHVKEAFNSSGSDTITIGSDSDTDSIATSIDVSTTGIKSVTLGVNAGYNSAAQQCKIFYTAGGTAPTTGKALIAIETFIVPDLPS